MTTSLYFGPTPAQRIGAHPFVEASGRRPFSRLRVAAAFATESGVSQIEELVGPAVFAAADKEWLIGLENGFTQPTALRRLLTLDRSTLCMVDVNAVLTSSSLTGSRFFHPKIYEFAALDSHEATIVATSANLTEGGLRKNVEQFLTWDGGLSDDVARTHQAWWAGLWRDEWLATEALISEYADRRPEIQQHARGENQGGTGPIVEVEPSASELRLANRMWVEAVRAPEGGSQNQLELLLNAHVFFFPDVEDPPRDLPRSLVFVDDHGTEYTNAGRQILFNGPPLRVKGNHMWRVYLPTAHEGLVGYQDGDVLIGFERTAVPDRYLIRFVPRGSPEAAVWHEASSKVATVTGTPSRSMGWTMQGWWPY